MVQNSLSSGENIYKMENNRDEVQSILRSIINKGYGDVYVSLHISGLLGKGEVFANKSDRSTQTVVREAIQNPDVIVSIDGIYGKLTRADWANGAKAILQIEKFKVTNGGVKTENERVQWNYSPMGRTELADDTNYLVLYETGGIATMVRDNIKNSGKKNS